MASIDKAGGVITSTYKKLFAGLLTSLVFLLPYERIPSLPVRVLGASIDLRLSFLVGAAMLILVTWSVTLAKQKLRVKLELHHYLLAAFFFVYLMSALLSVDLKRALTVWVFTAFTAGVGVSVGLLWQYRDSLAIRKALWITTWIVLVFGFYQYFGDIFGLPQSWTGLRDIYTKEIFGFPRIQSTGLEPLFYGNFLLIPFFYFSSRFLNNLEERPLLLIAISTQIALTVSRGALISGIAGLTVLIVLSLRGVSHWKNIHQQAGLIGITVLGTTLALLLTNVNSLGILSKDSSLPSTSASPAPVAVINQATNLTSQDDRVRNRDLAWQAFQGQPWLGIGPGNFSAYAKDKYAGYEGSEGYIVVNNEPLELLAESGAIGFSMFLLMVSTIVWQLYKAWQHFTPQENEWPAVVLAYLLALAIQYQTFSTLYIMHVWVLIGIGMGAVTGHVPKKPTRKLPDKKPRPHRS